MALAEKLHHTSRGQKIARAGDGEVFVSREAPRGQNTPHPGKRPEPLEEVSEPQVGIRRHAEVGFEFVLNPVVPQMAEQLVEVCSTPALAVEYISPAPAVLSPAPVVCSLAPASAVFQAPAPLVEYLAFAPAVSESPAPVVEYLSPAPAVSSSPEPVVGDFSSAPGVPVESSMPCVEQDIDVEEEEFMDCGEVYYSGTCEVFDMVEYRVPPQGVGTSRLLRHSEGAKFFHFRAEETVAGA